MGESTNRISKKKFLICVDLQKFEFGIFKTFLLLILVVWLLKIIIRIFRGLSKRVTERRISKRNVLKEMKKTNFFLKKFFQKSSVFLKVASPPPLPLFQKFYQLSYMNQNVKTKDKIILQSFRKFSEVALPLFPLSYFIWWFHHILINEILSKIDWKF